MLGRIVGAARRGHQHWQARVFEFERARSGRDRNIEGTRHDAVRVDMAAVRAAGFQYVDPQAVELERLGEVEMACLGEGLHLFVEQLPEVVESRIALGQVAKAARSWCSPYSRGRGSSAVRRHPLRRTGGCFPPAPRAGRRVPMSAS